MEKGEGAHTPSPAHHRLVEQAHSVGRLGLGTGGRRLQGLPLAAGHLLARLGVGLHAGRGERGRDGLGILHGQGHGLALSARVGEHHHHGGVAGADLARGDGRAAVHRLRLAHVHASPGQAVGGVGVAGGLHHRDVGRGRAQERAVARDGAVQGGERTGDEVLEGEHGVCAFCGCAALGMGGLYGSEG